MIISEKLNFLENFLIDLKGNKISQIKAIMVPHAGLTYSGNIAQWAYKQIDWNNYDKIILII